MNKWILFSLLLSIEASTVQAKKSVGQTQAPIVHKGNFTISIGSGFPSLLRIYQKLNTTRDKYSITGQGPFMAKADYFFLNRWSIGLNAAYSHSKISWLDFGYDPAIKDNRDYEYGVRGTEWSFLVRGNYHLKVNHKFDVYTGLGIGYGSIYFKSYTLAPLNQFAVRNDLPPPLSLEATIGTRYYFTKNIGVYSEAGLGRAWILLQKYFLTEAIIQLGLNVKF